MAALEFVTELIGIRLRRLERENDRLLKIVGQQRLEIEGMREVLAKKR